MIAFDSVEKPADEILPLSNNPAIAPALLPDSQYDCYFRVNKLHELLQDHRVSMFSFADFQFRVSYKLHRRIYTE